MEVSHYTQYFGIASYASKIALNRLDASHVLVSYTSDVEPWDGVDTLMIDSGGYSLMNTDRTEYQTSDEEYLDYVQKHDAEYAMLRDYPLGSDPDATIPELQQRTTEHQRRLLDRWDISTTPVAVVQGRSPRQYLNHVCQLRDAGILERTNRVAIGSLVGRKPTEKHRVITAVADSLGDNTRIHGLGVQVSDLSAYTELLALLKSLKIDRIGVRDAEDIFIRIKL